MKPLILLLLLSTLNLQAQTACDSVTIDCCTFISNDTLIIQVSNHSTTVLFDYPGFMLVDSLGDTLAIETVNYFGISTGPQAHTLIISGNLQLPFSGFFELYTGFYDSLHCTFPITISDTILSTKTFQQKMPFSVYPNPTQTHATIDFGADFEAQGCQLFLYDQLGRLLMQKPVQNTSIQLDLSNLPKGLYILSVWDENGGVKGQQKLLRE